MALAYRGMVNVMLIAADGSEYVTCFPAILNETMPGLFEMSTPHKLPAARGSRLAHDPRHPGQRPEPRG